jgi:hypothetical protein
VIAICSLPCLREQVGTNALGSSLIAICSHLLAQVGIGKGGGSNVIAICSLPCLREQVGTNALGSSLIAICSHLLAQVGRGKGGRV